MNLEYKDILTKDFLTENYIDKEETMSGVAKRVGCDPTTVLVYLRQYSIPIRNGGNFYKILTKEYLIEEYINKKQSPKEIGIKIGCSETLVRHRLKNLDISLRTASESLKGFKHTEETKEKMSEARTKFKYSEESKRKMSLAKLGKKNTEEHCKKISEARKLLVGEKSTNWRGGITPLHIKIRNLKENKEWVQKCFQRDNTCLECNSNENLEVHHIKEFCEIFYGFLQSYSQFSPIEDKETLIKLAINYQPFWDLNNGKTICYNCHCKKHIKMGVY